MSDLVGLPGGENVERGVQDLHAGRITAEALLVAMAPTRLRELGIVIDADVELPREPELALYALLGQTHDDPYYRYNALRRELDSFIAALQSRRRRLASA
ncbi:MAG: hypothetical protein AAF772_12465 [Acidobacteriota bacterium]